MTEPWDLERVRSLVALCRQAGDAIMEVYAGDPSVSYKADASPLTAADLAAHRVLVAGLKALAPNVAVVSEEGTDPRAPADPATPFWIVDPLDGTKEFIKRTGEFTVNVGLVSGGRLEAGVVHAPALQRTWFAGTDGARMIDESGAERPLATRAADPEALAVVASRDHAGPAVKAFLERMPPARTLNIGSSLKFCLVAEGAADLYFRDGPTMEWDTGAAQCVLERAGGGVYDLGGSALAYGKPDLRNPMFVAVGDSTLDWRSLIGEWASTTRG